MRSSTAAPDPFFVDCDESWLLDPASARRGAHRTPTAGGRVRAVIAGRSLRPLLRLRRDPRRLRATRRRRSSRTPPSRSVRPTGARRQVRRRLSRRCRSTATRSSRRAAAARSQGPTRAGRARPQALDAGPRAGAALRAHRDRLQLSPEQPPRRGRPCAARGAAGARRSAAADQRPLPRAARRRARDRVHARRHRRHSNCWLTCITVDPRSFGCRPGADQARARGRGHRGAPRLEADAPAAGLRGQPEFGGDVSARLFEQGLCLPSGSAMSDADQDRVVSVVLATQRA